MTPSFFISITCNRFSQWVDVSHFPTEVAAERVWAADYPLELIELRWITQCVNALTVCLFKPEAIIFINVKYVHGTKLPRHMYWWSQRSFNWELVDLAGGV